jgi:hypothetical protein
VTIRRWCLLVLGLSLFAAACGDDDPPAGQAATSAAPLTSTTLAATTTVAPTTATPAGATLRVKGMTLTLRPGWKVKRSPGGGDAIVTTGQPCARSKLLGTVCPNFTVGGPEEAYELGPYRLEQPYHPSTDVSECLTALDDGYEGDSRLVRKDFAPVGPKTAYYREWRVTCVAKSGNRAVGTPYVQRIWYLPKSKILVVDEYSTPGLAEALAQARFA